MPSRPENPPVVPLLQPHLSLQGEELIGDLTNGHYGDDGGGDSGYFADASHSEGDNGRWLSVKIPRVPFIKEKGIHIAKIELSYMNHES